MSLFDGTPQGYVQPVCIPEFTRPKPCTRALAKRLARDFIKKGESQHTEGGPFMWTIVVHCIENGINFRFDKHNWKIIEVIQ